MRIFKSILLLGSAGLLWPLLASAQEVFPVVRNILWQNLPVPAGDPATQGQFAGFVGVSSSARSDVGSLIPASGNLRLYISMLGAPVAGAAPDFALGDLIGMPTATFPNANAVPIGLRREPVRITEAPFKYRTLTDATVRDFAPANDMLSERFFWSPHARFTSQPDGSGAFEEIVPDGTVGASLKDGFVYASQGGSSRIYWRTTAAIGTDASNNPVYGLVERVVNVSTASRLTVRRIFWTEYGFQGQSVDVPAGEIQQVRIAYNDGVPERVPEEEIYSKDDISPAPTDRTLWHDRILGTLRAYNREGRVLIEFLGESRSGGDGLRRQVGIEVVDIIREALPTLVDVPVGEQLYPLPPDATELAVHPLPPVGADRNAAIARRNTLLAIYAPKPILSNANPPFIRPFEDGAIYYAIRTTESSNDVQVFWNEEGIAGIQWPKFLNRYRQYWPDRLDDYVVNVRPADPAQSALTPPQFGDGSTFEIAFQDNGRAQESNASQFIVNMTEGFVTNRTLLLISAGDAYWFLRVESVLDSHLASNPRYAAFYRDQQPAENNTTVALTALVGQRLLPPAGADSTAGYIDFSHGNAIDPSAYIDPFTDSITEAEAGAIIPVNAAPFKNGVRNDQLAVWWFKRIHPPAAIAGTMPPVYFPSYYSRYQLTWPVNAPQIVLASNAGSGDLRSDIAAGTIYFENDPAQTGYNPNEEHALMIAGRAYALRDDLNQPDVSSSPYVLVRFTNGNDQRPDMRAFRVLRENETYRFTYDARAGTVLQPPMPLAVMPPPLVNGQSANTEVTPDDIDPPGVPGADLGPLSYYAKFTFEDRNGLKWVYRGQHAPDGNLASLGMKFYYATLDGFAYPNATTGVNEAPPLGTITPFLHDGVNGTRVTGTAITVNYRPYWPDIGPVQGLRGEYFANQDLSGNPALVRVDPTVDFDTADPGFPGGNLGNENFSVRWRGTLLIPATGQYRFHVASDDGMRLWVDTVVGDPLLNAWIERAPAEDTSDPMFFVAGERVALRLEYFQTTLNGEVSLRWTLPDGTKQVIPTAALVPAGAGTVEVPSLQFAETLVKPKFGLPGVGDASSAQILYQQSIARSIARSIVPAQESVVLHDALRRKTLNLGGALPRIPDSIAVDESGGRIYFQGLPPHLQSRFYVDLSLGQGNPPIGALVLEGEFVDEIVGEDYILLNRFSPTEIAAVKALVNDTDTMAGAWRTAIDSLQTTLETFVEDPQFPGNYIPDPTADVTFGIGDAVRVSHPDQAVNSYALTAIGGGHGYVTLVLGNGSAFTDSSEPVQVHILRVGPDLYRGQLKPLTPENPLSEQLTLQHTGDFAGQEDLFEFQWYYAPPVNGQPPANLPGQPGATWLSRNDYDGPRLSLGASQPLLMLTDNYYIMRHRPLPGHALRPVGSAWGPEDGWSDWTNPALAEGWIKRVLAGINPFNQRLSDFFNNAVNTDVSLLTQAGTRWEGDIPLTLGAVQDVGLISIYETVLRRATSFTIEGTPGINYGPANDALLLAAGYLNDLYMALGNEAYADAANPLISLDVDPSRLLIDQGLPALIGETIQTTATARFAFEGQVASLLDEELVLLRGRDDFLVPGVTTSPFYNRFIWNFTRGINAGEVIYALNYNISEKAGLDADGKIDASDAARQYPQGHGDAIGHYLTAIKNYYRLLANPNFTWTPRVEAVNILGTPVTVDYLDERKFAAAAVGIGRTAQRILDLERRKLPVDPEAGWIELRAVRTNNATGRLRSWGFEYWASRAGQGNFLHWATANALLPENDTINEGIQKIDRSTVPELAELVALGDAIQTVLDGANRRLNALNLADGSLLFDLSPAELAAGDSHFDQILARAKAALANVATAHAHTVQHNSLLRSLENQSADYTYTVDRQEWAFENQLYDIYGMAYPGDIGPGRTYPQGYAGPDYLRYMFINRPYVYSTDHLFGANQANHYKVTYQLPIRSQAFESLIAGFDGDTGTARTIEEAFGTTYSSENGNVLISYTLNLNDGPYQIADTSMGQRPFIGSIQRSLHEVMKAKDSLAWQLRQLDQDREVFGKLIATFAEDIDAGNRITDISRGLARARLALDKAIAGWELLDTIYEGREKGADHVSRALIEGIPRVVGFSNDATFAARGALAAAGVLAAQGWQLKKIISQSLIFGAELGYGIREIRDNIEMEDLDYGITGVRSNIAMLEAAYREMFSGMQDLNLAVLAYDAALQEYQNELVNGVTILTERESFRKRAAAVIQGARTRDVAFRAFRTESLEQYKILFDQAAQYVYLAAKAYDYETGQLGSAGGQEFLRGIVASRALGLVGPDGEPQFGGSATGDPGLSSFLAKLEADWQVAKGRLGINNPDTYGTLLSLRRELFGLPFEEDGSTADHTIWQDRLRAHVVDDLRSIPAIAAHALPTANPSGLPQPGFVIPFSSTIEDGLNFFGRPLQGGDNAFSTASHSTKLMAVGVVFQDYIGMNPYSSGPAAPQNSDPNALAATPYVYLVPAGNDRMRTPPMGGSASTVRQWQVMDHAMPLPYDIGASGFGEFSLWTASTSLSEPFFTPRKHQAFRATDNPSLFFQPNIQDYTNRRLIGRSVWNTGWLLVIPAQTLLADPEEGIERFLQSVTDIKLFLKTYSHAGN